MRKHCLLFLFFLASIFFANAQYVTNGNASALGGDCFQLTPSAPTQGGSVWFQNKISLASDLTIQATINLGNRAGTFAGADGIAFVLQPVCSGIGGIGGGIGYQGIMPSLAVEFDTWQNTEQNDPGADHVGLMKNGLVAHNGATATPTIQVLQNYKTVGELEDGALHTLLIQWTALTKNLKITLDGTLQVDYTDDIIANIFGGNRNVFWGFTAATGSAFNNQSVCILSKNFTEEGSFTVTQPTCPDFNNGAIDLNPAGGVGPFTYDWDDLPGAMDPEDRTGLSAGTYSVAVKDANNCTSNYTIEVTNAADVEPPVVVCRDVTINLGPSPVTITALGPPTAQLPAQTKGILGFACPQPAQPAASCNCPTGSVAVGYTAETPTGYGNTVSRFTLNCRAVNPDGTFGASTSVTCYNGTATSTSSTDLAPSGEALVGFQNRMGCAIDKLQGRSKTLAAILAGTPNSTNTTLTGIGGNGGGLQPLQLAPDGNVIVGMQTYIDPSTGISAGYAWNYAKLEDVMRGIATATDNCGGIQSATLSQSSFDCSDLGINNVTVTVTDAAGNMTTCNFTVTVTDNEAPVITTNGDMTVNNDPGACGAAVIVSASATDNCTVGTPTGIRSDGLALTDPYPVGTTTITWNVMDASGNAAVAVVQTVKVTDNEKPNAVCKNVTVNLVGGVASITPADINDGSSDNCGIQSVTVSPTSFNCSNVGTNTVTLTVTDVNGNVSTCTATVTVVDNTPPTAVCKNATITLANGVATITAADVDGGSSDACGIQTMTVSPSTFTCANIGPNTVTLTVTDVNGNVSTCTATVTVVGTIPSCSIKSVPANNTYTGGNPNNIYLGYGPQSTTLQVSPSGGAPYSYSWSPATGLSNYNTANPVFAPTAPGNYTFTVTVTNANGCTTTCSITICVLDVRVPGTNGKKVYVCHVPQGNPANAHTIEVSVNAVSAHIFNPGHGDRLGRCDQAPCASPGSITRQVTKPQMIVENSNFALQVSAFPNPTSGFFNVRVQSSGKELVVVRVVHLYGRIVLQQGNVVPNTTLRLGEKLATGTYVVEAIQGDQRIKTKVLKVK